MDSKPDKSWAIDEKSLPATGINDNLITPAPYLANAPRSFKDKVLIDFGCLDKKALIRYTLDGTEPNSKSSVFKKPFTIESSVTVKFYAETPGKEKSKIISATMKKVNHDWTVKVLSKYSNQYTAGGPEGLVDGIYGEDNWRLGGWQGHLGGDFIAVIDLRKLQKVKKVSCNFLQDVRSWIWMPKEIIVYSSPNGTDFKEIGRMKTNIPNDDMNLMIKKFNMEFENTYTQYIKVVGVNIGPIPGWHDGAGEPAFIFIDEIEVE
jgi:hypothetical protein